MSVKSFIKQLAIGSLLLAWMGQVEARADVVIDFENYSTTHTIVSSSPGNPVITTIVDQTDPATNTNWYSVFNQKTAAAAQLTVSTAKPKTGANSLLISDNNSAAGGGFSAALKLASTLPTTSAFTLQFSVAINYSALAGNGAILMLGSSNSSLGSSVDKYWMAMNIDSTGRILIWGDNTAGTTATATKLADYSTYATNGSYLTFNLTLDPTQNLYTSIVLSGDLATSANLVPTAGTLGTGLANSAMGGRLPTLSNVAGTTDSYIGFSMAGTSSGDLYVDDISVTTVPEPSTVEFAIFGLAALLSVRTVCRQRQC